MPIWNRMLFYNNVATCNINMKLLAKIKVNIFQNESKWVVSFNLFIHLWKTLHTSNISSFY